jgi:hypothetical protein
MRNFNLKNVGQGKAYWSVFGCVAGKGVAGFFGMGGMDVDRAGAS